MTILSPVISQTYPTYPVPYLLHRAPARRQLQPTVGDARITKQLVEIVTQTTKPAEITETMGLAQQLPQILRPVEVLMGT